MDAINDRLISQQGRQKSNARGRQLKDGPPGLPLVRSPGSSDYALLHDFSGFTRSDDWLVFKPDTPLDNIRYIRIYTVSSPSWVARKEMVVLASTK